MHRNIDKASKDLQLAQQLLKDDPMNEVNIIKEIECRNKYQKTQQDEESYARQKARQNWLSLGNSNTKFFYVAFKSRKTFNCIRKCKLQDGSYSTESEVIKKMAVQFFKDLLNQQHPSSGNREFIPNSTVSEEEANVLGSMVSDEEIK